MLLARAAARKFKLALATVGWARAGGTPWVGPLAGRFG
jgi:hypothetical protein